MYGALDRSIRNYPRFSDARYYQSKCLELLEKHEGAKTAIVIALNDFDDGHSFCEDNSFYEQYPYQVMRHHIRQRWKSLHDVVTE